MKKYLILFILLINIELLMASTINNDSNILHSKAIKNYLTTSKAIGIDVKKTRLRKYYKKNNYNLIWFKNNKLVSVGHELIDEVNNDIVLNKNILKYLNIKHILLLLNKTDTKEINAIDTMRIDLLLTNLYDMYISYLSNGSINWKNFHEELKYIYDTQDINNSWEKSYSKVNKLALLNDVILKNSLVSALKEVKTFYMNSSNLEKFISKYEFIIQNGGFTKLPNLKYSLKPLSENNDISILRQRILEFAFVNDIKIKPNMLDNNNTKFYDNDLKDLVEIFQKNNGLYIDGKVGRNTIKRLNVSAQNKINQIKVNLERMRWLKKDSSSRKITINIPDFYMYYHENNETLKLPVVVGTKKHPTPIFSHKLSKVVLNPYWRVPTSIVNKELVPKLIKDSSYILKQDMNIHENWDSNSTIYDPNHISWDAFTQNEEQKSLKEFTEVPFKFIQQPGYKNPLGKMKFLFPNRYSVYLHDTNEKDYFNKISRSFSHGCIRLKHPIKLLEKISTNDKSFSFNDASTILKDKEKVKIELEKKIPINIIYLTMWIDENNELQHRKDIYDYDKLHYKLMNEKYISKENINEDDKSNIEKKNREPIDTL